MVMLIVFVLIIAGLIAWVIYVERRPYRPAPMKYVSSIDPTNNRSWCKIHSFYFANLDTVCPMCQSDYHNDVNAGVYPPGINESNQQFYYVEDWIELRKIDIMWQKGQITEQEAISRKEAYIRNTIPKRIAVATGTDPGIQRARIEANQKRARNYAGAAQYSGITIPK